MSQQLLRPGLGGTVGGEGSCPSTQPQNLSPRYSNPLSRATLMGRFCASESHRAFLAPSLCVFSPCRDAVGAPPQGVRHRSWGRPILPPSVSLHLPPQAGSAGDNGQVDITGGFVPLASSCGQTGLPGTGNFCHHTFPSSSPSLPTFPALPPVLSCHPPTPSSPSSSFQRPGAARTKHNQLVCSQVAGPFPSLSSLVPLPIPEPSPAFNKPIIYCSACSTGSIFPASGGSSCSSPFSLLDPHCFSTPTSLCWAL